MRKRRTRGHIIADLSVNHVERFVLRCGFTTERIQHDYGIDLLLYTYDANGEPESDAISIQVKATDHIVFLQDGQTISFGLERADLERWLTDIMPVLFILYDAQEDAAYWLYIQAYFEAQQSFVLNTIGNTFTVYLSRDQVLGEEAVRQFAQFKRNVQEQLRGVQHYGE